MFNSLHNFNIFMENRSHFRSYLCRNIKIFEKVHKLLSTTICIPFCLVYRSKLLFLTLHVEHIQRSSSINELCSCLPMAMLHPYSTSCPESSWPTSVLISGSTWREFALKRMLRWCNRSPFWKIWSYSFEIWNYLALFQNRSDYSELGKKKWNEMKLWTNS